MPASEAGQLTQRTERIDELLRQEIMSLLTKEVADPDIGFATVTEVETSPDLRHARVWVSVIGQPKDRATTLRGLERAMPFVRRELGRRLRLRRIPEFSVKLDDSIERGSRVMHLISELEAGVTPGDLPEGESLPTPAVRLHHEGDAAEAANAEAADLEALGLAAPVPPGSPGAPRTTGRRGSAGRPRDSARPGSGGGSKGDRSAGSRGAGDGGPRKNGRSQAGGASAGGGRPSRPSGRGSKPDGGGRGA
jgi:ribosome-binding factor A